MPLPKRKFREIVFQLLYSRDLASAEPGDLIPFMMQELSVTKGNMRSAHERMEKILERRSELDEMIAEASKDYELVRIQRVERNILRLGFYELFFDEGIPPKVAISEALRLCRKFSTPESAAFVNAILDQGYKASLPEEEDKMKTYFGDNEV